MTLHQAEQKVCLLLTEAGIEAAPFEAAQLCCAVLGLDRAKLLAQGEAPLPPDAEERLLALAQKRAAGYPLQYLLGEWEFYGAPFAVGEGVLIPRADTETLCEKAISLLGEREAVVLDLCSGSGCIAVTIARECPNSRVYAVEKSPEACSYLRINIERNRVPVTAICADALAEETLTQVPACDIIVSNPPYLTAQDMAGLQREVAYEPSMALLGGEDGLQFYRELTRLWKRQLKPGGWLLYEIGMGQESAVREILEQNGLESVCTARDLCGIIRVIGARTSVQAG